MGICMQDSRTPLPMRVHIRLRKIPPLSLICGIKFRPKTFLTLWQNKTRIPVKLPHIHPLMHFCGKTSQHLLCKGEPRTKATTLRQVQRIKDLSHGLVSKQLRLLLKGDSKFYRKIVRTTNEEHLLSCILAEAKRMGLTSAASIPDAAAPVQTGRCKGQSRQVQSGGKDQGKSPKGDAKGKSPQGPGQQKGAEKGKSKEEPRRKGNSKGLDSKNKGKGKGLGSPGNPIDRSTFSIVPDGWNVLPAVEYNGTMGGIFAIESEEDARKLAESCRQSPWEWALVPPGHSMWSSSRTETACSKLLLFTRICINSHNVRLNMRRLRGSCKSIVPPKPARRLCTSSTRIKGLPLR